MNYKDITFEVEEGNYWLEDTRSLFLPLIKDLIKEFGFKAKTIRVGANEEFCILLLKHETISTIVLMPRDFIENAVAEKHKIRLNWFDVLELNSMGFFDTPIVIKLKEKSIGDKFLNEL